MEALPAQGIEISDVGLAVAGESTVRKDAEYLPPAIAETAQSTPRAIPEGSPVIIATIDDGIGIANHRFRLGPTETRVRHFLDLALIGEPTAKGWVDDVLGRSWTGTEIIKLLCQDEEQVYRAMGLIDPASRLRQPLRAAVSHGTHVLDIAAGYDWRKEAAQAAKRPIIAVQFPAQVAENRSDTWLPQSLKRALDWILVKADELSAKLAAELSEPPGADGKPRRFPLIVNASFASMAGPQDGYSDVEQRLTQFLETYRGNGPRELCNVVFSAGNTLQLRAVAQMDILPENFGEIQWRVLPDDKTPNFVEIWLPTQGGDDQQRQQAEVSLVPPRDAPANIQPSRLGAAVEWRNGKDVAASLYHQRFPRPGGSRECVTIAIRPTADDREGAAVVPSGRWRIRVKNTTAQELGIGLRVHRDDVGLFAGTGARQSYFEDASYERFEPGSGRLINDERRGGRRKTRITREGTLNTYAYADGVIAVGGYRNSDDKPAPYSAAGSAGQPPVSSYSTSQRPKRVQLKHRTKDSGGKLVDWPDLAAVSEESPALDGVLAAGTYSGSTAILGGTSVAAPQVTRARADEIATGGSLGSLLKPRGASGQISRPLRDGLGLLPFRSSYPKRR